MKQSHIAHSKRSRRKSMKAKIIAGAAVLVAGMLVTGLGYLIFYANVLGVKTLVVEGERLADPDMTRKAVEAEIAEASGFARMLGSDRILFWTLNSGSFSLPLVPVVEEADVEAKFFSRSVYIKIRERVPVGVLCATEGKCYAMDEKGVPFWEAPETSGGLVTKIWDGGSRGVSLGNPFFDHTDQIENLWETLEYIKSQGFIPREIRVLDRQSKEWEAVMPSGLTFLFSFEFVPEDLSDVLYELKEDVRMDSLDQFDFRVRNRVFYR